MTFILENWEGDWTMRGGTSKWRKDSIPADAPIRVKNMIEWVNARQKGVDRARNELYGNWLIRPDGSYGWAQEYFSEILEKSKK